MKTFKETITLNKNSRGCWILDTIKGCSVCSKEKPNGCYGNCYAKGIADRYGFDFSNFIKRNFYEEKRQLYFCGFSDGDHASRIVNEIRSIGMPFIRIGEMGDPSEDWAHTIGVCKKISCAKKPIVIITKHWKTLTKGQLKEMRGLDICINTSISAMDNETEIKHRLSQYSILKRYCNSVLRIVSCDFNKDTPEGAGLSEIQDTLFKNDKTIDTVFRPSVHNELVEKNIIKIRRIKFLGSNVFASVRSEKTYFGYCKDCPDMCGINL